MPKYHGRPCNDCGRTEEEGAVFGWHVDTRQKSGGRWRGHCNECAARRKVEHYARNPEKFAKAWASLSDAERIARSSVF